MRLVVTAAITPHLETGPSIPIGRAWDTFVQNGKVGQSQYHEVHTLRGRYNPGALRPHAVKRISEKGQGTDNGEHRRHDP